MKRYTVMIIRKAKELIRRGKREIALDLLVHTLLSIREPGVLWLWHGDEFIYFERKSFEQGSLHCAKFPALSNLLKDLGFR